MQSGRLISGGYIEENEEVERLCRAGEYTGLPALKVRREVEKGIEWGKARPKIIKHKEVGRLIYAEDLLRDSSKERSFVKPGMFWPSPTMP